MLPSWREGQKPEDLAAKAMDDAQKARDENVAQAAKSKGKQVFIPRDFLQLLLGDRKSSLAAQAQPSEPTPGQA